MLPIVVPALRGICRHHNLATRKTRRRFLVSGATERHHVPRGTRLILSVDISFFNGAFLFFRQKTFALQHEYTPTKGELPCALTALQ